MWVEVGLFSNFLIGHIKVRWRVPFSLVLRLRWPLVRGPAGAKPRKIAPVNERKYVQSELLVGGHHVLQLHETGLGC